MAAAHQWLVRAGTAQTSRWFAFEWSSDTLWQEVVLQKGIVRSPSSRTLAEDSCRIVLARLFRMIVLAARCARDVVGTRVAWATGEIAPRVPRITVLSLIGRKNRGCRREPLYCKSR